jgi:hypothetical protein
MKFGRLRNQYWNWLHESGFEKARLQPCRRSSVDSGALAPEGSSALAGGVHSTTLFSNPLRLLKQLPQPIQLPFPFRPPRLEPLTRNIQPRHFNPATPHPPSFFRLHQARVFEYLQVLHHCGQRHLERLSKPRDRHRCRRRPNTQPFQHCPSRRIPKSAEDAVDVELLLIHHPAPPDAPLRLSRQLHRQLFQKAAPARFPHLRPICALKKCSLKGKDEIGALIRRQQLNGAQRYREVVFLQRHG